MNNELWSSGAMFNIKADRDLFPFEWVNLDSWDLGVCLTSCRHNLPETRLHYIYSPTLISLILFQIAL